MGGAPYPAPGGVVSYRGSKMAESLATFTDAEINQPATLLSSWQPKTLQVSSYDN